MKDLDQYAELYTDKDHHYEIEHQLTFNWYVDRVVHFAPDGDLLELGIGYGASTKKFSRAFRRHMVIEGSGAVIENFKRRHHPDKTEIVKAYFEEYDSEEKFDVIVMGFILEHVDDPGEILRRFRKFLRPNGRLFVAVPNAKSLHRRIGFAAGLLPDMYQLSEYDIAVGHKRYFDLESISALIQQSGYRITRTEGIFLKPMTTNQIKALNMSREVLRGMLEVGMEYPELSNAILIEAVLGRERRRVQWVWKKK
ncbi:MAG: class I SAM-dependent methyltransferase [Bacillota bacterium]